MGGRAGVTFVTEGLFVDTSFLFLDFSPPPPFSYSSELEEGRKKLPTRYFKNSLERQFFFCLSVLPRWLLLKVNAGKFAEFLPCLLSCAPLTPPDYHPHLLSPSPPGFVLFSSGRILTHRIKKKRYGKWRVAPFASLFSVEALQNFTEQTPFNRPSLLYPPGRGKKKKNVLQGVGKGRRRKGKKKKTKKHH